MRVVNTIYNLHNKTDMENIMELQKSTKKYFEYCQDKNMIPTFTNLAWWYKCHPSLLYKYLGEKTPRGAYLRQIKNIMSKKIETHIIKSSN